LKKLFYILKNKFQLDSTRNRFIKGSFWTIFGSVIASFFSVITSIVIARVIGKELFGQFGIVQNTISMFLTFATFGLGLTITKYLAEYRNINSSKAERIISLSYVIAFLTGGISTLILFFSSAWVAKNILSAEEIGILLKFSSITLLFSAINGVQLGELLGFESYKSIAKANVFSGVSKSICLLIGVTTYDIKGAIIGLIFSSIINVYFFQKLITKERKKFNINVNFQNCFSERKILFNFSIPALFSGLISSPITWLSNVIIVNQPNGYAEMGLFNAANQWKIAVLLLPTMASRAILPMLSNSLKIQDIKSYKKIFFYSIILNLGSSSLAAVLITLFAPFIINFYGKGFEGGNSVFILLAWSSVLSSFAMVIGQIIASNGNMWIGFLINSIWALSLVGFTWSFRNLGALGLSKSYLFAYTIHVITALWYTVKIFQNDSLKQKN
jgi:O-antigen/teichoic acid export membrane protein